jgi:low temperature requirement protein LtrA
MSFFMIWLAWMNYTWLASAYDDGSLWFRIVTMVIMFGALVLAAGIPAAFEHRPLYLVLAGFVTMRLGLVLLWLAVAGGDPDKRTVALRYAGGIGAMQIYWIALILLLSPDTPLMMAAFSGGFAGELVIPAVVEKNGRTNWHRHHIIERYGLSAIGSGCRPPPNGYYR